MIFYYTFVLELSLNLSLISFPSPKVTWMCEFIHICSNYERSRSSISPRSMAAINVQQVIPENSCVPWDTPFSFGIEYECLYALKDDLEWKMVYVGSAENETHDQVLDSVLVGPVLAGNYKFVFEGNAPDASKIPIDDLMGVTVVLLTCR